MTGRKQPGPHEGQASELRVRVAYVLGSSGGGTGAHVAALAHGCADRGLAVSVFGPAETGRRFFPGARAELPGDPSAGVPDPSARVPDPPGRGPDPSGQGVRIARQVAFTAVEIAGGPRPADLAVVLRLRRRLRLWSPSVVHAHGLRAGALAALSISRHQALVVTVHNAPPEAPAARAVYSLLERIVARRADAVTWVSGDLGARMRRRRARDGGRAMVPAPPANEPSPADIATARASLGEEGVPVVLAAGRLASQKGFGVLMAAAARWQDREPVPVLAIAGEGPLAEALAGQARAARLPVRFLGQRADVPALLAAADVIVVPSLWEGQPLIVQEALRAGKPLVASDAGGIPELTGEDGAILVPPGDPGALAAAVRAVLTDPRRAVELGAAARRRAAGLPIMSEAVDAVIGLYQRLLG